MKKLIILTLVLGLFSSCQKAPRACFEYKRATAYPYTEMSIQFDSGCSENEDWDKGYLWDFGDGSSLDHTLNLVSHRYNSPGKYVVKLTVKNKKGHDKAIQEVEVLY
jgi:PKD repeat protein